SCVSVQFKVPQPIQRKAKKEFPISIIGKYNFLSDTLIINRTSIQIPIQLSEESGRARKMNISDSLVLKHYKNAYFLSIRDKNEKWDVLVLGQNKDKNLIVKSSISMKIESDSMIINKQFDRDKEIKKLMSEYSYLETVNLLSSTYCINPTRRELNQLIKKNLFREIIVLTRIK
uniref:hypothetical protein n=1 Tax=Carboxylicivirga marina TaxID=2800988 RepID=UPI0025961E4A